MMRIIFFLLILSTLTAEVSPTEALKILKAGNERYVKDQSKFPNRGKERREMLSSKQKPYAIILSCSDSRVPPEIVFDQGIGDLFVVRVAGNVIDPVVLDSIEYAALHLDSSLIVVLGHESCGAVNAVVEGKTEDVEFVARLIQPAVDKAQKKDPKNLLYASIIENANLMKENLLRTPILRKFTQKGHMDIVSAYYSFETGKVYFLDD